MDKPRQLAFVALRAVHQGAYADAALDKVLRGADLSPVDRRLVTELVYGSVRRQRSLDALIDQLAQKTASQQPPDLRTVLHLGLYQLRYQERIPASAAVNTTVQLAKDNGFLGLAGFVNGLLRQYSRLESAKRQSDEESLPPETDPLQLPEDPVERLGILYSYPNWIVELWLQQLGRAETERLCEWMNQSPVLDLRVNCLRAGIAEVEAALQLGGVLVRRVPHLPQALRLIGSTGPIQQLPGFAAGWWTIQDSSAQLVTHLLDPQPHEVVIDACAAPGGKTTHIAELMRDTGTLWACDRAASRMRKLQENTKRLQLQSVQICVGDSRNLSQFEGLADRLLLDVPCSGLGTLHRHADARWQQTPGSVQELSVLQAELLQQTAAWVKPGGILVYATCTLHPLENEAVIESFLKHHPNWNIEPPTVYSPAAAFATVQGWVKLWPHQQQMDGFFMVRLRKAGDAE